MGLLMLAAVVEPGWYRFGYTVISEIERLLL